ncbi:MAG: HD domain-containing protein, partial [Acidimicrobiia bacterium]|nr:HD domain-containing protein [Acidimicrobiia bacterium]
MVNWLYSGHDDLANHGWRVAGFVGNLATHLQFPAETVSLFTLAGVLHDVGKRHLPRRILDKDGPLTAMEWAIMRLHPELGHRDVWSDVAPVVSRAILHHHERFDGTGYPFGLAGSAIPEASRALLVADAFDAMTSTRTYQPAMPVDWAIAEL